MTAFLFFQRYLLKELKERKVRGYDIDVNSISLFQVLLHPSGGHEVNINEEVKENPSVPHPDSAWATLTQLDEENWSMSFDFTFNKGKRREHVETANQYIESSKVCLEKGLDHPLIDNLYSAMELLSKALLIEFPQKKSKVGHGFIAAKMNMKVKEAVVGAEYAPLLNRLANMREKARYLEGELALSLQDKSAMVRQVEQFYDLVSARY